MNLVVCDTYNDEVKRRTINVREKSSGQTKRNIYPSRGEERLPPTATACTNRTVVHSLGLDRLFEAFQRISVPHCRNDNFRAVEDHHININMYVYR